MEEKIIAHPAGQPRLHPVLVQVQELLLHWGRLLPSSLPLGNSGSASSQGQHWGALREPYRDTETGWSQCRTSQGASRGRRDRLGSEVETLGEIHCGCRDKQAFHCFSGKGRSFERDVGLTPTSINFQLWGPENAIALAAASPGFSFLNNEVGV